MLTRMRRLTRALAALGLVLVTAACAGSDDTAPDTTVASATTALTTTTSATTSSSAPPTTTALTTAAPPTTSAAAPTTSTPAGDPDGTDPLPPLPDDVALPIVFVHGFAGSAQQYESQKMRFVANGYPADRIVAFEHDGAGMDLAGYAAGARAAIDEVLQRTGATQVYLVGHSRGTFVSSLLLSDPTQAAKVAKYVAIDGAPCPDTPVPCLAPNQAMFPGQSHVETATSPESFAAQYEFLVGRSAQVVDITPQKAPVMLSGRAVNFPANTGRADTTLEVWRIDPATGHRTEPAPIASTVLGADGAWGPIQVETGASYEYALTSPDSPSVHHVYLQPYVRSSDLVRLLSSPADGPTRVNTNSGDDHSALVVMRMREWYALDDTDLDGDQRDVLTIATNGGEPVDVLPSFVGNGTIGVHVHDDAATPGVTTLIALPYFSQQPFQSGVDVFMPASPEGSGTITLTSDPRGDHGHPQRINVPNWPSSAHAISVVFADHLVD